jgi:hypothetical protein
MREPWQAREIFQALGRRKRYAAMRSLNWPRQSARIGLPIGGYAAFAPAAGDGDNYPLPDAVVNVIDQQGDLKRGRGSRWDIESAATLDLSWQ